MKAFTHSVKEPLSMILVLGLIAYYVGILGNPMGPIIVILLLFKRIFKQNVTYKALLNITAITAPPNIPAAV